MNGAITNFRQNLNNQPAQKQKDSSHYCAPRVKSPLLDRILKLGGKEMPASDKDFWAIAPKVNEFILTLIEERVAELEEELAKEPAVEAKKAAEEAKKAAEEAKKAGVKS